MAKKNATTSSKSTDSGYDATRDLPRSAVMILHVNSATGERVGGFGEGVESFGICIRQMIDAEGKPSPLKLSVSNVYVAKRDGTAGGWNGDKWMVGADGRAHYGTVAKGHMVLGSPIGRLEPQTAATVFAAAGAFAEQVKAALSKSQRAA